MLRLLATAASSSDAVGTLVGKLANGWDSSTARTSLAHLCGMAGQCSGKGGATLPARAVPRGRSAVWDITALYSHARMNAREIACAHKRRHNMPSAPCRCVPTWSCQTT